MSDRWIEWFLGIVMVLFVVMMLFFPLCESGIACCAKYEKGGECYYRWDEGWKR